MDSQKNQQIKKINTKPFFLKKQALNNLIKLLINYMNAKSQEFADINFQKFKTEFLKQKKMHPLFDVNQLIGEILALNGAVCQYYFDIVLHRDDLPLFTLLLECGLNDVNIEGLPILHSLISCRAVKCLKAFLSIGKFSRHFVNGEYSPLALAVSNSYQGPQNIETLQNIEMLQMMVEHPDFKMEYLKYEQEAVYLNPLLIAITNFHYKGAQYFLKWGAPSSSKTLPVKGFDLLFAGFLNYYTAGHSGELHTGRKQNNYSLKKEMMTQQNITRLFYLLLNHTTQASNIYQLIQPEYNPKKMDIFLHLNGMLEKNLNIKDGPLKLLLDILVSAGVGLFFHDLPKRLKEKYKNVPPSAEIVIPVISDSGQVISICYSFADFESYLENHHASFQVLEGLNQYLQNKIAILKPEHPNYAKVKKLAKKLASYVSAISPTVQLTPVLTDAIQNKEEQSLLGLLSALIANRKEVKIDKDNLSLMLSQQKDGFDNLIKKIPDEKSLLAIEKEPKAIHLALEFYFSCLSRLYHHLIILNQIYRQLCSISVYERDFGLIHESIEIFNAIRNRIDFYSMQWIYYTLHVQNIKPEEIIKLVQILSTIFDLIHKNMRVNDQNAHHSAYYRMQYLMQALLVGAYLKTNNLSLAKKAFKQALLVLEAANNLNLFTGAYTTLVHHFVVRHGFLNMMNFGMVHMPDMVHTHLCQIIQYEKGMILSDQFLQDMIIYLKNKIKFNQFAQVNELLDLLAKNMPQDKKIMLFEIIMLKNLQHAGFLQSLKLMIDREDLSAQIKLDDINNLMIINFQQTCLSIKKISSFLPCFTEINHKVVTISFTEFSQESEMQALFLAIKKINYLAIEQKQKQEMQQLEARTASLAITANLPYMSPYTPTHDLSRQKPKKGKSTKPDGAGENEEPLQENKIITEKINVTELKKFLGLGDDYSDLIMIYSSYSKNNRKFIVIKNDPEFEKFLNASCLFKNKEGEWGVNSVNPYGENQHGVKYDKKRIGEKEVLHVAKLKASGSDRALGYGKEINFKGIKIIVCIIDTILPHNKAEKVFRFS